MGKKPPPCRDAFHKFPGVYWPRFHLLPGNTVYTARWDNKCRLGQKVDNDTRQPNFSNNSTGTHLQIMTCN